MDFGWIVLIFIGAALFVSFLHVVTRMASERESLNRRRRAPTPSLSGDTITYAGHS